MTEPAIHPLQGVLVLDFTRAMAGPYCTMMLADLGATVVKVEGLDEGSGDTTRSTPPMFGDFSPSFLALNRSKLSLAMDLRRDEAKEIVTRLVRAADVVVENFRPDVTERFGLTWPSLSKINPSVVLCSISGYGRTGPLREKRAYDLTIEAAAGAMDITGEPDRPPVKMGVPVIDIETGVAAAASVVANLVARQATGAGCHLDVALFDVSLSLLSYMAPMYLCTGQLPTRLGSGHPTIYPYNAFETSDGYVVVAPFTQRFWRRFCEVIGRSELAAAPEFEDFAKRLANRGVLAPLLEEIFRTATTAEWLERLQAGDVPAGPVNSVGQALDDAQTRARDMVVPLTLPDGSAIRTIGSPFHLHWADGSSAAVDYSAPPLLGQDSRNVLTGIAGLSPEQVDELVARHVVGEVPQVPGRPVPAEAAGERAVPTKQAGQQAVATRSAAGPATAWGTPRPETPVPSGEAPRPLRGLKVLDLTRMAAGPFCTLLLSDLGADVIKVEAPRVGDPTRRNLPMVDGESTYFLALNRGKRSTCVDLKSAEGRQRILEYAREADVLVENFRPGVLERLGLSYDVLREVNPGLVVCSISGFGQDGPSRDRISFDVVNQGIAGFMSVTGEEGRPPVRLGLPVGDLGGGLFALLGVLAAVYGRTAGRGGAYLDLSLHDALVAQLAYLGQGYLLDGRLPRRVGSGHVNISPYRAYETKDGYLAIAAYTQPAWERLTEALDRPSLQDDERFATRPVRREHMTALDAILEEEFSRRTTEEWVSLLDASGVPCAKVGTIGEALDSDQAAARGMVLTVPLSTGRTARVAGSPFMVDGRRLRSSGGPPVHRPDDAVALAWLP